MTQRTSARFGTHLFEYDLADWPLAVCTLKGYDEHGKKKTVTKQDIKDVQDASQEIFDVCYGKSSHVVDRCGHAVDLCAGAITVVIDLREGFVPSVSLLPCIIDLIKNARRHSDLCVAAAAVVVNEGHIAFVRMVAALAGASDSVLVTDVEAAYRSLSSCTTVPPAADHACVAAPVPSPAPTPAPAPDMPDNS